MKLTARIETATAVILGVLKIRWTDGYEGIVDLRPVLSKGEAFEFLQREPERFNSCAVDPRGNHVLWLDDAGEEIELGTLSLRDRAERQAAILHLAS